MKLRKATLKDISEINLLNFEMHRYLASLVGKKFSDKELEEEKISTLDFQEENYYVAEINKKIVGFVSFGKKTEKDEWYGKYVYLNEIAVTKEFRGKGLGKKLFGLIYNYAKKRKINIKTDTIIKNKATLKFYEKLGFKPFSVDLMLKLKK